jgi:hypothetical protein
MQLKLAAMAPAAVITLAVFSLMLTLAMSPSARRERTQDQASRSVTHSTGQRSIR